MKTPKEQASDIMYVATCAENVLRGKGLVNLYYPNQPLRALYALFEVTFNEDPEVQVTFYDTDYWNEVLDILTKEKCHRDVLKWLKGRIGREQLHTRYDEWL